MEYTFKQRLSNVVVIIITTLLLIPCTSSAISTMPTSGTCAMLVNHNPLPPTATATFGLSTTALLTFTSTTAGTGNYANTEATYTNANTKGITINPVAPAPFTFTIAAVAALQGTKEMTMFENGIAGAIFYITPVNGGNTLLMQGRNVAAHGVCQF